MTCRSELRPDRFYFQGHGVKSNKFGDELPGSDGEKQSKAYSRKEPKKVA